jgi:hypothetical protein
LEYNENVDLTNFVLDMSEAFVKGYAIVRLKPYATVKVRYSPQGDSSGKVDRESVALTVSNGSFGEIDVQRIWFLTSFNRPVYSESIDSNLPVKVSEDNQATYFVPVTELKAALNKIVGETIVKAVALDKDGHRYEGRADRVTQEALVR